MSVSGPVIVVEDDKDDQEIIAELLNGLIPNPTVIFPNGEEALHYLQGMAEEPLVILSDINMPLMNGLELRRKIMQDPALRKKSIPFVFLTTSANNNAVKEAFELQVQGFFIKPSEFQNFRNVLRQIIDYWKECLHVNRK